MPAGAKRYQGFLDAMEAAGLEPAAVAHGAFTSDSGHEAIQQLLDSGVSLDGLFVASDLMAVAAIRALRDAGRRVPDDIAVVGFDDSSVARTSIPQLTSMTNPAHELALAAGRMLRNALEGRAFTFPVILNSDLVVRGSA